MNFRYRGSDWFAGLLTTIVVVFISGSLPCKADSMTSLIFKFTIEETADIRTVRANIQESPAAVINKTLLKDVELRCQSDTDFTDALKVFHKA